MSKEWEEEPDIKEFESEGYKCIIKRHPSLKHLCGYVHIYKSHRLYGIGYSDLYDMGIDVSVHGGLTYAEQEGNDWVFGFDCAHFMDLVPSMSDFEEGIYRNMEYVENEIHNLANQLKELENVKVNSPS